MKKREEKRRRKTTGKLKKVDFSVPDLKQSWDLVG